MTNEEAVKIIDHLGIKQVYDDTVSATDIGEALTLAISALDKQIPIKPMRIADVMAMCPRCASTVYDFYENVSQLEYCRECGQAIDWSGDD